MIFDDQGLPKDNGADDYKDSARLAGLMALFDHSQAPQCDEYLVSNESFGDEKTYAPYGPRRHPMYSPKDFSRDQMVPLAAGLWKQTSPLRIPIDYRPTNGDWLSPSQKDHLRRCSGLKDTWLGRMWLHLDIYWSAYVDPMAEPNQILSMLVVAGPEWVKKWCKHNWRREEAIFMYWGKWRRESEFAAHINEKTREIIK